MPKPVPVPASRAAKSPIRKSTVREHVGFAVEGAEAGFALDANTKLVNATRKMLKSMKIPKWIVNHEVTRSVLSLATPFAVDYLADFVDEDAAKGLRRLARAAQRGNGFYLQQKLKKYYGPLVAEYSKLSLDEETSE